MKPYSNTEKEGFISDKIQVVMYKMNVALIHPFKE